MTETYHLQALAGCEDRPQQFKLDTTNAEDIAAEFPTFSSSGRGTVFFGSGRSRQCCQARHRLCATFVAVHQQCGQPDCAPAISIVKPQSRNQECRLLTFGKAYKEQMNLGDD